MCKVAREVFGSADQGRSTTLTIEALVRTRTPDAFEMGIDRLLNTGSDKGAAGTWTLGHGNWKPLFTNRTRLRGGKPHTA